MLHKPPQKDFLYCNQHGANQFKASTERMSGKSANINFRTNQLAVIQQNIDQLPVNRSHSFSCRRDSLHPPATPKGRRSQSIKWLSVPSVTSLQPLFFKPSARACAFFFTCCMYSLNSGVAACLRAAARAAIWLLWGPPCKVGWIAKLMSFSKL